MVLDLSNRDASLEATLGKDLLEKVSNTKLLIVGAGGIGCELLKDLVLTGFRDLEVVDLDTIDVTNLNRQFLFRKHHVDRPKSEVAAEAVKDMCPSLKIVAHCGNVKNAEFGLEYIAGFDCVINALDNVEARRHVNRVCLAAGKPLIESGSTGYVGQATVIKGKETECYECIPKATATVFAFCTIRSTPEKPIHAIIWARQLYNLLFGPMDEDSQLADMKKEMDAVLEKCSVQNLFQFVSLHFRKKFDRHSNLIQ